MFDIFRYTGSHTTHLPPSLLPSMSFALPQSPPENSALLCPIELIWVNYTIVELEALVNVSQVPLHPSQSSLTISPITPGTSYTVNVSFVNEVGESQNNPTGET